MKASRRDLLKAAATGSVAAALGARPTLKASGFNESSSTVRPASAVAELLDLDAIQALKAERHLRDFVRQAWHIVEPATPYIHNWHIDALCDHLETIVLWSPAIYSVAPVRNLLVTMPPRAMKSLVISVFFPAWTWIHRPELRFLYASYAQSLAIEHSMATRRVIESDWYQRWWGDRFALSEDDNLKTRFSNDHRGYRLATSVGAAVTGFGGDVVVADDPHNVQQAESDAVRQSTLTWWDQAMSTRLNNPKTGARIIVMQRVHEDDLAGHVASDPAWTHLNLPMEYEPTTYVSPIGWSDPRTVDGELLWPERMDQAFVETQKRTLGSYAYAGQYQQRPAPAEGGMFKREWWQTYHSLPKMKRLEIVVDSAFKEGVENDYSVFALWGSDGAGSAYLINIWRGRWAFPELIKKGHAAHQWACKEFPGMQIPLVVEDKASGQSAIQVWKQKYFTETGVLPALPVVSFKVKGTQSKTARAEGVTPIVEGGRAFLPASAPWLDDFVFEHSAFPTGEHDDQVDTTSMGLTRLTLGAVASVAAVGITQQSRWR